jgi:uncharacterized protein (TIGR03437 family)
VAAAIVDLGPTPGDHIFRATVGGNRTLEFFGFARPRQTVSPGGIVDAATFHAMDGFAPGSYISVFGNNLSPASQSVPTPALPFSLSDVSVGFFAANGRFPGRLHFVGPGQINVQIPWELAGQTEAHMVIRIGEEPSDAYVVPLAAFSPGVFSNGAAILDHPNNQPVTEANPAPRGSTIQVFANGMGPVDNRPASGELTPDAPALVRTTNIPAVTIGGLPAQVDFSGMAPGYVGLYQINVVVPAGLAPGVHKMRITIGGVASRETDLPVQ